MSTPLFPEFAGRLMRPPLFPDRSQRDLDEDGPYDTLLGRVDNLGDSAAVAALNVITQILEDRHLGRIIDRQALTLIGRTVRRVWG